MSRRSALSRTRLTGLVIAISVGVTALMSWLLYREVRGGMLLTGFVCAALIDQVVQRMTRSYRRKLRAAHDSLERRVRERTAELERANQTLIEAAAVQAALRDELMVRDRMATAGTLAAGVTHEIRSPLSVLRIAIDDLIEAMADPGESLRQLLDDASEATERITVIVRDLSSLARPVDDPLTAIELGPVIDSAARLAAYRFGKGVVLNRQPVDVPPVRANASRLVQLLLNLLINAARATREGVTNTIEVGAVLRDGHVAIVVTDTGSGMSAETLARAFEPFFTTGGDSGGTGIGLAICRAIVEKCGGTIAMTSEPGQGTRVEVRLLPA